MSGSSDRYSSLYDPNWVVTKSLVRPDLGGAIQRAREQLVSVFVAPIHTIDLGRVCVDGLDGYRAFPIIPDAQEAVVGRSEDVRISQAPLDLRSASVPVGKGESWSCGCTHIPRVDPSTDSTGRKVVGMVGGEVDIGDGSGVRVKNVFDRCVLGR